MTCKDYEASVMFAKINGNTIKTLDNVIVECLNKHKGNVKREELIHMVSLETGIDKEDLSNNINLNLSRLEREGLVQPGYKTGYWMSC